ncbi:hypothetical protein PpBr36_01273 [Pyricularia pennisetigena]|uniref:hypothetical protein n=1 Tax=Pyricularia pennisetigena TaxID=1578925 RepID=UPI0011538A34|nr:hypothetical protein PpBr36_01273 [Pyricularia pennisetigena]TLS28696.1 hypothetical protein PpBr36_01273 [Pyricularia pennisetigena]
MLNTIRATVGSDLSKRWIADQVSQLPAISPLLKVAFAIDFIIFLPLLLFANYTLASVFTTLAVVENTDSTPSYASLSAHDEEEGVSLAGAPALRKQLDVNSPSASAGIVTSGLRATCRHLYRTGGVRLFFRGMLCAAAIFLADSFIGAIFLTIPIVFPFGRLVAYLALCQLHTAWVHIVISDRPHGSLAFWRRLPPFGKTFNATKYAVGLFWLADLFTGATPYMIASFGGKDGKVSGLTLIGLLIFTILMLLVRLPSSAVLTLVQASLLPEGEGTIVPFDRSFGGRVGPSELGGAQSLSVRDAFKSLSRESWIRVIKMFLKTFLVIVGLMIVISLVVAVQIVALQPHAKN